MADDPLHVLLGSTVKKRLEQTLRNPGVELLGYLYGGVVLNKVHIIGCVASTNSHPPSSGLPGLPDWKTEFTELSALMPKGIQLCGIYCSCQQATRLKEHYLDKVVNGFCFEESLAASGKFLCLQICTNEDGGIYKCFSYDRKVGSLTECEYQVADICDEFLQSRISFRIQANIQISSEINQKQNSYPDIAWKIEKSCQTLSSASTVFYLKDCNMLLRKENSELSDSSNTENCETLLSSAGLPQQRNNLTGTAKNRTKQKGGRAGFSTGSKLKDFLEVRVLHQITEIENKQGAIVPVIQHKKVPRTCVKLNFPVEALLNLPRSVPIQKLPQFFSSAICCQLRKMASVMRRFSKDGVFLVPKVYHFKLPGFCHLVTAVYPSSMSKDSLVDNEEFTLYRLELHKQLLLPQNQPLMRPSKAVVFGNEQQGLYLTNPHEGIGGGSCGFVAVVDGTYTYHHYMQDNFNDDGWGCAYRSLQTIVSWFRCQGYTSKPVPSHREIQQALVDLQDKDEEFVGSRQWIGSFEVSMCLEHLLGVTSKILFVSSGADMRSKGRDLLHHFQTQGTPIMIGGGVLAHTILGVDFNDQTGDIRFLILDPHYTGGEDLKIILDKGWCGWKGPDFWNQQAHYNMCLPQRPDMI